MKSLIAKISIFSFIILLLIAGLEVSGQTTAGGELGIDINGFGFNNNVKDKFGFTLRSVETNRTLSSHFLKLNLSLPIVSDSLGRFFSRVNIMGAYDQAKNMDMEETRYINPDLYGYTTQLNLFPFRRYPLQLTRSNARDFLVRYEPNNRSNIQLMNPGLSVVRRYESEKTSTGLSSQVRLSQKANLTISYGQDKSEVVRHYDFGENFDIWISELVLATKSGLDRDSVTITNMLPDADLFLTIESYILDTITLAPAQEVKIEVDTGWIDVHAIPLTKYNQLFFRMHVTSEMLWDFKFFEPSAPNDVSQTSTNATFMLELGDTDGITNQSVYTYSDQGEINQGLKTFQNSFSNMLAVPINNTMRLDFLSSFDKNQTKVDTLPSQLAESIFHMTTFNYGRPSKMSSVFSHSFTHNLSNTGIPEISGEIVPTTSDVHNIQQKFIFPSRRLNHQLELKASIMALKDSKGYKNNQYSTTATNRINLDFLGVELEPRFELKYSINHQTNPDKQSTEIQPKLTVRGAMYDIGVLGNIKFDGEYSYRKRSDALGTDTKDRYVFASNITKEFSDNVQVSLLTTQEYESYGGTVALPNGDFIEDSLSRPGEYKASYKISSQVNPIDGITLTASYLLISQKSATIKKIQYSLIGVIPIIKLPIKSFITTESRDLDLPKYTKFYDSTGLFTGVDTSTADPQTQFSITTKVTYRFRQIALVLSHSYTIEKLIANRYSYYQIDGRIIRQFDIF